MMKAADLGSDRIGTDTPFHTMEARAGSGTILKPLDEIREILRDLDERGWETALPKGGPGAFLQRAASVRPPRPAPAGTVHMAAQAVPREPASEAAAMVDRLPAVGAVSLPRRNGRAFAVLMAAGLLVLSASGLVVAQGSGLSQYAIGVFGNGQARTDAGPVAAAHAALPPVLIPAVAKNHAAAAPLPTAAARPKPLPIAFEGPMQGPGARAAFVAPQPARTASPQTKAPVPSARAASAHPTLAAPARRALDPSVEKSLRQAGDIKILEGDIASARLFYERAADAGDARAAFDLGDSFNPAFLARMGVRGMRGDIVAAAHWYRRAVSLGSPDAGKALRALPR